MLNLEFEIICIFLRNMPIQEKRQLNPNHKIHFQLLYVHQYNNVNYPETIILNNESLNY